MKNIPFKSHRFYFLLMLFLALVVSCASKKRPSSITHENLTSQIIFLNYSISKVENGKKTVQFISKNIVNGKLKNQSTEYLNNGWISEDSHQGLVGDLICSQLNKDSIEIASIIIKNPLIKSIEFINDSLNFESKTTALQKAHFSLRLQLHPNTTFLAIKEITDTLKNCNTLNINKIN